MKFARSAAAFVGGLVVGAAALTAWSQEKPEGGAAEGPPSMEEMMKKWKEVASPGAKHKALDSMVGTWDTVTRMWMAPGAPPSVEKGTTTTKWVLGGRWLASESSGSMMGMPMQGIGYLGYDNFRKRYVQLWMDSISTCAVHAEGAFDQSGKALHLYGHLDEWLDGTVGKNIRLTTRIDGPDRMVFEIHDLDIGESNTRVIEIEYTRRK